MAKSKTKFFCSECGYETSGWMGKCPNCSSWNTIVEEKIPQPQQAAQKRSWLGQDDTRKRAPVTLDEVSRDNVTRYPTGITEFDRVLGGGLVKGSVVLLGGEPGIGKSTIMMQLCKNLTRQGEVTYISGEESPAQIGMRADRLFSDKLEIKLFPETSLDIVAEYLKENNPAVAVIDSVQTMYDPEVSSAPGSVTQLREVTAGLVRIAKTSGTSVILSGHVTKDGALAGPRILEHMVDVVLYFEGDRHGRYRIIRSAKNRFGSTDEIAVFEMTGSGLKEVSDPSSAMLEGRPQGVPGTVITACMEGTRPILAEVQALLNDISYSNPARVTQGLDRVRTGMILAVLERHMGLGLNSMDAYINIVGGLHSQETATDLAVAAAVISAAKQIPLSSNLVVFGELGLTGEIRPASFAPRRAAEAKKEGFHTCILPGACKGQFSDTSDETYPDLIFVDNLGEMADVLMKGQ